MFRSIFPRLMAAILVAILICTLGLSMAFYVTMRNNYIDTRMNELKVQAYDIAYLASRVRSSNMLSGFGYSTATENYISWKANTIYDEFKAYSIVVDRSGQVSLFAAPDLMQEQDIPFDRQRIIDTLAVVLKGKEVVERQNSSNGPTFTVAVPWIDNGIVLGAVFIQTAAQEVYATYQGLALKTALTALFALLLACVSVFLITRQIVKPLRNMAVVAGELAEGHFDRRVPVTGSRETRELASAFNLMAAQLETLEQTRRDFIANVSHELRSPMTSIQGFLQGMLDGTVPPEEHKQYMEIVLNETRRLSKLVGNLLNLSRMESDSIQLALSDFDLHESIRRVIIANLPQLDSKQLDLQLSFDEEPLYANGDPEQIEQVLINLLSNAIKYTPENGHIGIDTAQEGDTIRVTVRDDGPGILPEDAPYIFDRFYKADKSHTVGKGTGLGLAICKRILEKHGQSIRLVPSTVGAAFEFTLKSGHAPEPVHREA